MTDYTDLIARLRRLSQDARNPLILADPLEYAASEAADAIEALQEVLTFYASESLWDHDGGLDGLTPMERDSGQKARSLLYGRTIAARQAEVARLVQQTTGDVVQTDKG